MIRAAKNQSEKASTSLSSQDYWIVTGFQAHVYEKTASFSDVELQIRNVGGVFRLQETLAVESGITTSIQFNPYIIVPKNADIRLRAIASAAGIDMGGSISGYLAIVV